MITVRDDLSLEQTNKEITTCMQYTHIHIQWYGIGAMPHMVVRTYECLNVLT